MSTSRRSKALPTDGPGPRFLYAMLKQLDLKSIDWNLVASENEVSNGHAARMRYSRFRQGMDGEIPKPRESRAKKDKKTPKKSSKTDSCKADDHAEDKMDIVQPKQEVKQERDLVLLPSNPFTKIDPYEQPIPSLADIPQTTPRIPSSSPFQMSPVPYSSVTVAPSDLGVYTPATSFAGPSSLGYEQVASPHHFWAPVKPETEEHEEIDDAFFMGQKNEEDGLVSQRDEVEYQGTAIVGMDVGPVKSQK